MRTAGLRRQIVLSMATMAVCVTLLVVLGSYVFWYIALTYWPGFFEPTNFLPTLPELIWMLGTALVAIALAIAAATRLAQRILVPLNSVADSIQRVAAGDLSARAESGDPSLGEAASLAGDFNSMANQLERVTREQAQWNAAIAHELRTPVTILRGRLQGLADGVFEPSAEQFQKLLAQVEGLTHLIDDLRVLALVENGHLQLQMAATDLAAEIRKVAELYEHPMLASGQHLVLDLHAGTVACDPVRIRQALMALLENAQRYAVPGQVRISTSIVKGQCTLSVEDDGPGVSAEAAHQLFNAFWRGEASRSRDSGGSGLGLAVVRAIAQAHGGEAACMAARGGGTSFQISWPAQ